MMVGIQRAIALLVAVRQSVAAALMFYTCLPVPASWVEEFQQVARLAPLVGVLIGILLAGLDFVLQLLGMPVLTRSALIVSCWVGITGGLHLDGAMDTADGLAVQDPDRRLEVMADSVTGAFGAIAAGVILLVKTAALSDLDQWRWLALVLAAGWGRWAQQVAIARYPYLKSTGKGAFHKTAISSLKNTLPSLLLLSGIACLPMFFSAQWYGFSAELILGGGAIAWLTSAWFAYQLGGHTGDTYGATVEWSETFFLVWFTVLVSA